MDVCLLWVLCVSGTGLCIGLITRPEESYWLWCIIVWDIETSWMRRPWPTGGCCKCCVCQVQVSASGWSLLQRSHTDCGVSLCGILKPREWGGFCPLGAVAPKVEEKKKVRNNGILS
jgi:hypothetical protein